MENGTIKEGVPGDAKPERTRKRWRFFVVTSSTRERAMESAELSTLEMVISWLEK